MTLAHALAGGTRLGLACIIYEKGALLCPSALEAPTINRKAFRKLNWSDGVKKRQTNVCLTSSNATSSPKFITSTFMAADERREIRGNYKGALSILSVAEARVLLTIRVC